MKIKNLSGRNLGIMSANIALEDDKGNTGFTKGSRILLIAESTLDLKDKEYEPYKESVKELVTAGVVEIVESAISELTKQEIIDKVAEETDVALNQSMSKGSLQDKAEALGVEV